MAVRKNVGALTAVERSAFTAALKSLKSAPSRFNPPTNGRYDDYVYVHMQAMLIFTIDDRSKPVADGNWTLVSDMRMPMWAHRCPAFLPWHRELLRQFELDLQAVSNSPDLGLPYWDWTVDQSPTGVPWTADLLGGDGQDGPVTSGPFAGNQNWPLTLTEDGVDHLVRGFGLDSAAGPRLPTPTELSATLGIATYDGTPWSDRKTLATFRNQLEGWHVPAGSDVSVGMHNLVHLWVGGNKGTMLPSTSPNDPAFFLHHCNIDRLWSVWQRQHTGSAFYLPVSPIQGDPGQSLNEKMTFFDPSLSSTPPWSDVAATPASVVDHTKLGYSYDTDPAVTEPTVVAMAENELEGRLDATRELTVDPLKLRPIKIKPGEHFKRRLEELSPVVPETAPAAPPVKDRDPSR
jgi:tyrosinase